MLVVTVGEEEKEVIIENPSITSDFQDKVGNKISTLVSLQTKKNSQGKDIVIGKTIVKLSSIKAVKSASNKIIDLSKLDQNSKTKILEKEIDYDIKHPNPVKTVNAGKPSTFTVKIDFNYDGAPEPLLIQTSSPNTSFSEFFQNENFNIESRGGFNIVEFNTKSTGKGKSILADSTDVIKSNVTIYAIWKEATIDNTVTDQLPLPPTDEDLTEDLTDEDLTEENVLTEDLTEENV